MAIALVENIQRADLNALEEAEALKRLITECGLTHEACAEAGIVFVGPTAEQCDAMLAYWAELLHDHGHLEEAEDVVVRHGRHVAAAAPRSNRC